MENIQPQWRCYYKIFPLETWSLALKIPKGLTRWHSQTAPGSHYASCGKKLKELLPDCRDHRTVFEMDSSFSASKENTPGALKSTTFASPWPSGIKRRCWQNELTLTQWKLELNWNDPLPENTQALWLDCRQNLILMTHWWYSYHGTSCTTGVSPCTMLVQRGKPWYNMY